MYPLGSRQLFDGTQCIEEKKEFSGWFEGVMYVSQPFLERSGQRSTGRIVCDYSCFFDWYTLDSLSFFLLVVVYIAVGAHVSIDWTSVGNFDRKIQHEWCVVEKIRVDKRYEKIDKTGNSSGHHVCTFEMQAVHGYPYMYVELVLLSVATWHVATHVNCNFFIDNLLFVFNN